MWLFGAYSQLATLQPTWFSVMSMIERWTLAVAAFNAGIGSINAALLTCISNHGVSGCTWATWKGYLPAETVAYVTDVMQSWEENPADEPVYLIDELQINWRWKYIPKIKPSHQ